jgi:S1-C subfamily serine protease
MVLAALALACGCKRTSERSIASVAASVAPSVVNVYSAHAAGALDLGSGVIVAPDGVIVTNYHVVERSDAIEVVLFDGREFPATVVGADPRSDVAVLRIDAHGLRPIRVADSSRLHVGDVVLAFGDPYGIGQTVTMGIVSGIGRTNLGINETEDFIQTDAAINPGNSGGPLVNMDGRLVGINTVIVSRNGGSQGLGFAIPSSMVLPVASQIVKNGKVTRGWFGVIMRDQQPRGGVRVAAVTPDSPAYRAGIARGDVIVGFAGVRVRDAAHLRSLVEVSGPIHVRMAVQHAGHVVERDVALVEPP